MNPRHGLVAGLFLALSLVLTAAPAAAQRSFEESVQALGSKQFAEQAQAIADLGNSGEARAQEILSALLENELYQMKSGDRVVLAAEGGNGLAVTDAATGEALGNMAKGALRKIRTNNTLRQALRSALATLALAHPDPERRKAAAAEVLNDPSAETLAALESALAKEEEPGVRTVLEESIATLRISSGEPEERIEAIRSLSGSLSPIVRGRLLQLVAQNEDGSYAEEDEAVRAAAERAVAGIENQLLVMRGIETLFFGISLGSILLLAAIGLAITFGVMGVINMAHGEMMMIGAYTTFVVQQLMPGFLDYSLIVAVPAAFLVAGLVGVVLERTVIRFLYGRPLETLLATFGVSLILQQAVRTIFSPLNRSVVTPSWMSGAWEINGALALTYNRLAIIVFCLVVFAGLLIFMKKTWFGLRMRAVTQNRRMANSMGINSGWIDALTFGLGSGVAGIAGVALSQLTNVGPNLGQAYIVDCFMVVVFGGVGNLWGTFVGAMTLGLVNKLAEPYAGAVLGKVLILVLIILFIQRRPRGLFALKGRTAEG